MAIKVAGMVAAAVSVLSAAIATPENKVVFLDIGQGDSILLQNGTTQILVDGGPGSTVLERLGEELPAFDRTIEVMIATHPQQDHIEGLRHVVEQYRVGLVVLPQAAADSNLFETFINELIARGIPYQFAWAGQQITTGDITLSVLAPFDSELSRKLVQTDINNAAVITRVDFNELSFLLSADAESPLEQFLVSESNLLDVDILKAGHHGSNTSTHLPLLRAATPRAVVISVGQQNRYGHPHPAVLQRLKNIPTWRTDEHSSVRFLNRGDRWYLSTRK